MEYLVKHLSKSQSLPFDAMKLIYEYADPMVKIKQQIKNREYYKAENLYKIQSLTPICGLLHHFTNDTEMMKIFRFIDMNTSVRNVYPDYLYHEGFNEEELYNLWLNL